MPELCAPIASVQLQPAPVPGHQKRSIPRVDPRRLSVVVETRRPGGSPSLKSKTGSYFELLWSVSGCPAELFSLQSGELMDTSKSATSEVAAAPAARARACGASSAVVVFEVFARAVSTTARRSTSMDTGCPDEYSA